MSLNYGYYLYYLRSQLWDVLDYIVALDKPCPDVSTILTAGNEKRDYPLYIGLNQTEWDLDNAKSDISSCLALPFTVDDAVQDYLDQRPFKDIDRTGHAYIGCIYMSIVLDQDAIERTGFDADVIAFEFSGTGRKMSWLFEKSPTTHRDWLTIARETNALYGVFHRDAQGYAVVCWLDGKEYLVEIEDEWMSPDEARKVLKGLNPADLVAKPNSCPLHAVKTHK